MVIAPTCGLFVDPSAQAGSGTQAAPFAHIADALASNPQNLPIYVYATHAAVTESITLKAQESLYGALTCGTWTVGAAKTPWTAQANQIPLTLTNTTGAVVSGFAITSATATGFDAMTLQGASSIGVWADGASATLENVDIVAGNGATGGDGTGSGAQAPGRQSAAAMFDGNLGGGCAGVPNGGGAAKDFSGCPAQMGTITEGGKGGDGGLLSGVGGQAGAPDPGLGTPNGAPGAGEPSAGVWDCTNNGGNAQSGHSGPDGGAGSAGSGTGSLTGGTFTGAAGGTVVLAPSVKAAVVVVDERATGPMGASQLSLVRAAEVAARAAAAGCLAQAEARVVRVLRWLLATRL